MAMPKEYGPMSPDRQRPLAGGGRPILYGTRSETGAALLSLHFFHDHRVEVVDELGAIGNAVVPDQLAHARRPRREHDQGGADRHRLLDRVSDEDDRAA